MSEQAILVDEAGNPLKKVECPSDYDSEDEVASVENDMARSIASERVGFGTQSLLEQWMDSYGNGDYDEDPYDDDIYEDPSFTTLKVDIRKGIAKETDDSSLKLVQATRELTKEEIQSHIEKKEQIERATQEAKLIELSKPDLIKVVKEVASEAGVDPKALRSSKGGKEILKKHNAEFKVFQIEHLEKLKKSRELKNKRFDQLKEISGELGINLSLPLHELDHSLSSSQKRKELELGPEIHIAGLECNHSLLEDTTDFFSSNSSRKHTRESKYGTKISVSEGTQSTSDNDDDFEYEGEDIKSFGQLFESTNTTAGQSIKRTSRKTTMPSKSNDYVLNKNVNMA
nr:ribonuclease H-like domain-containing protein [Tanacetum cinerariifolium]